MSGILEKVDYIDVKKVGKYDCNTIYNIEIVYIISGIIWLALTLFLGFWNYDDIIVWLILSLPLVVFAINYLSLGEFSMHLEDQMLRGNLLSFGFLVAIVLINWNSPFDSKTRTEFYKILVTAFILLMVSLVDLWVGKERMPVVKHIKTVLHTGALTLLALALYLYYTYQRDIAQHRSN